MTSSVEADNSQSLKDALHQADENRSQGETYLRKAQHDYRQILEHLPAGHDQGLLAQKAWETEQLLRSSSPYFSQAGQDRYLDEHVFERKRNGVFVEIGAYDGVTGSNCLFFEAMRDWSGLIVEPSPVQFHAMTEFRRSAYVQAAIGPEEDIMDFIHVTQGYTQMSGLSETYDDAILGSVRNNPHHQEEIVKVSTRRLDKLLREHDILQVDYCSLDVEGAELLILSSFPFDAFDISVWTIENTTRTGEIQDLLESNGYRLLTVIGCDEVYQKSNG